MTHQLSRRERKAMRRAGYKPGKNPLITVDSKGIKSGIAHVIANVIAVFIFPIWLLYMNFQEWREERE